MTRFVTVHEDNPLLFEDDRATLTEFGSQYMDVLDSLTGVRHDRLRLGLWVAAEGMIYEEFSNDDDVVDRFRIPKEWPRWLAIDFGVNNPFVCQWWTKDPKDDILYLYREIYHTGRLVEEHAHQIQMLSSGEHFQAIICDHDLEGRLTLEKHLPHTEEDCPGDKTLRWSTQKADKEVENGLQLVKMRMKRHGIKIFRDCLVELDQDLKKFGKPTNTLDELPGYVWDVIQSQRLGERELDKPRKKNDHGMDALRYLVKWVDDPNKQALLKLISGSHRMTVKNQRQEGSNDKWLAFFR
jgi:phage terminase large subunit